MPRPKTPTRGAADAIAQVIRKGDRLNGTVAPFGEVWEQLFKPWLKDWDRRAAKKAGGLGRK